jgi:NADH dehydrogenase
MSSGSRLFGQSLGVDEGATGERQPAMAERTATTPAHDVVTGAFGYTGRYIARRLLAQGRRVTTLTSRPGRADPFGGQVQALPFTFDSPSALTKSLEGVNTLYNAYWVRFAHGGLNHEVAARNSRALIQAAEHAGVRRFVHVSITGASSASPLSYFRGKGLVEEAVQASRLSYAILRPTIVFGREDILVNNIAWLLRRFPLFVVPGNGQYRVQPVSVEDLTDLAVALGQREDNVVMDAIGPERYAFDHLVRLIAQALNKRAPIVHSPPSVALTLSRIVGTFTQDVMLTKDEIAGLSAGLMASGAAPTCPTRFSEWVVQNAEWLGKQYTSELARHYR